MADIQIAVGKTEENSDAADLELNLQVAPAGPLYFDSVAEAEASPLARSLLQLASVSAVLLQGNKVTICRANNAGPWPAVLQAVTQTIEQHYAAIPVANPRRERVPQENELMLQVQDVLNHQINPMVASHGGFIEVVDVRETVVFVNMTGGCQGCGMASATLKQGVERVLRKELPQITEIYDNTDHASGANPYYAPGKK